MNSRNHISRVLALGAVAILTFGGTACGITDSADEVRRVGVIGRVASAEVVVPDTVRAGVEFVVEITTSGVPCDRKGEAEVQYAAKSVTITPYDYFQTPENCFSLGVSFVHQATVQFAEPGLASVVILGRERSFEDEVVEVVREVVVIGDQVPN